MARRRAGAGSADSFADGRCEVAHARGFVDTAQPRDVQGAVAAGASERDALVMPQWWARMSSTVWELRDFRHPVIPARFTPNFAFLPVVFLAACAEHSRTPLDLCADAMTTTEVRECVDHQTGRLQRQLSAVLDSAKRRSPNAAAVDSSQSAWLRYRKAQCEAEARTAAPLLVPRCWLSLTTGRIDELRHMYRMTEP